MAKKVIALTGGIGSGKSTAGRFFVRHGFCVLDCDRISAEVAEERTVLDEICKTFGNRFVVEGMLDRRALAAEVFADKQKTQQLNGIFHPRILQRLKEKIDNTDGVVFVEIPLLTDGLSQWFDEIWLFAVQRQKILERVSARDNRTEEEVQAIIDRQSAYSALSNVLVVSNNGTQEEFEQKLFALLKKLLDKN